MLTDAERTELIRILCEFHHEAKKEGTIGHGLECVNIAIGQIEGVFADYERKPEEPPLRWEMPPGDTPCEICGRGFTPRGPYRYTCNSRHSDQRRAKYNRMHASNAYYKKKRETMEADIRAIKKDSK